ncbi:MAG: hypothetical protein GXO90_02450 [FCB group bacterium]|nr:hypothetical protein [FCB group bacterium]
MKKIITLIALSVLLTGQSVQILSPLPNSSNPEMEILIATSFYGMDDLDPAQVRLKVDGFDVTGGASIDRDMLTFSTQSLTPGKHTVSVLAGVSPEGRPLSTDWSFTVEGEKAAKFDFGIKGKLTSGVNYDKIDDQSLGVSQMGISLRGQATEWVRFNTDIKITSEEDPLLQPRNKYALGLEIGKWIQLTLGDANPRFSQFTASGKRMRGFDALFTLGPLGFHYAKGEINRTIQGPKTDAYSWSNFSLEEGVKKIELDRRGYTFQQNMDAMRFFLGKGTYGQWGFNLLHIRDDKNSVNQEISSAILTLDSDTLGLTAGEYTLAELLALDGTANYAVSLRDPVNWTGATPQDNLVVGTDLGIYLDHKRVLLEGEVAFSLLNRNIWDGAFTTEQLDTLMDDTTDNSIGGFFDLSSIPINPQDISNWFIVNQYMSPLIPIDIGLFSDSSDVTVKDAILSMPSLAFSGRAAVNYFGNLFTIKYSQVGPDFTSLANPYLLKDNREWSINDKLRLLSNRLMLTVGYKHQSNDILPTVTNPKVQETLNSNINFLPGPNLPSINLSVRKINRSNGITEIDTVFSQSTVVDTSGSQTTQGISFSDKREKNQTLNIVTTISHRVELFGLSHNLTANIVLMNKEDQLSNRDLDTTFIDPRVVANVYSFNVTTRFKIPLKTTFSVSSTHSEFNTSPTETANQDLSNFSLNGEYSGLMKNTFTILGGANVATGSGNTEFSWIGFKAGLRWKVISNLSLNALGEYRIKTTPDGSSNTIIGRANLTYIF